VSKEAAFRWSLRGVVLVAVVLIVYWVAKNTYWDDIVVPTPFKGEAATDPQYALKKFLAALDMHVEAHRSFNSLPPTNTILFANDWHWDLIDSRRQKIEDWVRAGGRLVLDDTVIGIFGEFVELSGIERRFPEKSKDDEDRPSVPVARSEDDCATWDVSIDDRRVSQDVDHYSLCNIRPFGWLMTSNKTIWALRDKGGFQAVRVQIGQGTITVINAHPFDNRNFRDLDRGRLLVATMQLQHHDDVWLLTEADHPSLLTLVWQNGAAVVILFALFIAALCWRNAVRFGPLIARDDGARRSLVEQIRGTGWFILRLGGARTLYGAMVRALKEAAGRRISRFADLTPEQQVSALATHTELDRETLQEALYAPNAEDKAFDHSGSRHRLYRAIVTLEAARRALARAK
jgi:hypothetical protein